MILIALFEILSNFEFLSRSETNSLVFFFNIADMRINNHILSSYKEKEG